MDRPRGTIDPTAPVDSDLSTFGFDRSDDDWLGEIRAAEASAALGSIGPYELLSEISRGGQGVVYRARQAHTKRDIAVKRLLGGALAGDATRRRFEREVEAAAALNHPHIVTVYGMEIVDDQPLLAMEWVDGVPVTDWIVRGQADAGPRNLADIIRLFLQICDAIRHAHQHGVIHRDLKPSNILVDRHGRARVLDFGLAKLISQDPAAAIVTQPQQFVGTPAYASPEQVRCEPNEVDVRTDVYSLGVILYQMLTGQLPYALSGSLIKDVQIIQNAQPQPASSLNPRLDRELDAIAMKALAKDKTDRYQSVDALAEDVTRYLAGEPIKAHPPSTLYQFRKLVKRHRLMFALATMVVVLITSFGVVATVLATRLAAQRRGAVAAKDNESRAREATERINAFLVEMLESADPDKAMGREVTVREVLDEAARKVEDGLAGQGLVEASVRFTIAKAYRSLGLYEAAEPHFRVALEISRNLLGDGDPRTLDHLRGLAALFYYKADFAAAEPLYRRVLALRREVLGETHPDVAMSLNDLATLLHDVGRYDEAESLALQARDIHESQAGPNELDIADSLSNLAAITLAKNDAAESEALYERALAIRRRHAPGSKLAETLNNLAVLASKKGDYERSESLYREAVELSRRLLGDHHIDVAIKLSNLANVLRLQAKFPEAETLLRQALAIYHERVDADHPGVGKTLDNLAWLCREKHDFQGAEGYAREALALYRRRWGDEHLDTAESMSTLGAILMDLGNLDEAESMCRQSMGIKRDLLGDGHESLASPMSNLAWALRGKGDWKGAERCFRDVLALRRATQGDDHPDVAVTLYSLASVLHAEGDDEAAEATLRESLAAHRRALGREHPGVAMVLNNLATLVQRRGDFAGAESLLEEAVAIRRKFPPSDPREMVSNLMLLGRVKTALGRPESAESLLREAVYAIPPSAGPPAPVVSAARVELGRCLTLLERYDEAEPLLLEGFEDLEAVRGPDHEQTAQALCYLLECMERR